MEPFDTNAELLAAVAERADEHRVLGYAPGGEPVVAARAGGDREPPIVLTAGSHATEQAGVRAAVELLDALDTDRALHVLPSRDPMGLNGYGAALEAATGESIAVDSFDALEPLLREHGEVVHQEDDFLLTLVGDTGFAAKRPGEAAPWSFVMNRVGELEDERPEALEPLKGRRLLLPPGLPDVEGTGNFRRAYTLVIDPEGRLQHLNRCFDREWAPVETRCARRLLEETGPGLFVDLHEATTGGGKFWFTTRHKDDPGDEEAEERIGRAVVNAVADAGGALASWDDKFGNADLGEHFFEPIEDGLFWLDYEVRGRDGKPGVQGLNATDYAADAHGLAFTNETDMYAPFEDRVEQAILAVQTAVDAFEAWAM